MGIRVGLVPIKHDEMLDILKQIEFDSYDMEAIQTYINDSRETPESSNPIKLINSENNDLMAFAIMKSFINPLKPEPKYITAYYNYIYTVPKYRKRGVMTVFCKLIKELLIESFELPLVYTAVCCNDYSTSIFKKMGFVVFRKTYCQGHTENHMVYSERKDLQQSHVSFVKAMYLAKEFMKRTFNCETSPRTNGEYCLIRKLKNNIII